MSASHRPAAARVRRTLAAAGFTIGVLGLAGLPAGAATVTATGPVNVTGGGAIPAIHHVWTIVLENSDESATLAQDNTGTGEFTSLFTNQGAFIPNYYATGHSSLDNYIALAAAQGPTPQTQGDCSDDNNPIGGNRVTATFDADGQALGTPSAIAAGKAGCTYPADVPTIGTQLSAAGYPWKTYAQGMDDFPKNNRTTCQSAQYAGDLNAPAGATNAPFAANYARKHDPELYFYGVTGIGGTSPAKAACDSEEVGLGHLSTDLAAATTTPSYSLIVPDLCNDAHDSQFNGAPGASGLAGCKANSVGPDDRTPTTKSGIAAADDFLADWVPKILASPAYADNGLLLITFDEGTEAVACCNEVKSPNLPVQADNGVPNQVSTASSTATTPAGAGGAPGAARGGGQIGMIAISPFITPGTTSLVSYNHFSYVRTIEDMFHLTPDRTGIAGSDGAGHIGYAGSQGGTAANAPSSFGSDVFDNPSGATAPADLPESRLAVLLPISGILLGAALLTRRMRRRA